MRKGMLCVIISMLSIGSSLSAQTTSYDYNPLYGPPSFDPLSVARRLSYENFRSIKLLHAAIMNFGGGEAEVNKLVDQYAEASAMYFQNMIKESAEAFTKNQKEILAAAQRLARKYKEDTDSLLTESIKLNFKNKFDKSFQNIRLEDASAEKYLQNAQWSVAKATDYFDRFKDARTSSAIGLINAIYYFRAAKEEIFKAIKVMNMDQARKDEFLAKYKKDIVDDNNKVYESRVKER
jgi:hypothetical protein